MSGKRLLDIIATLNASVGVARKHLELRSSQKELYGRVSSLAEVYRSQTGKVTQTLNAASFLVSRFNELPYHKNEIKPMPQLETSKDSEGNSVIVSSEAALNSDDGNEKSQVDYHSSTAAFTNELIRHSPNDQIERSGHKLDPKPCSHSARSVTDTVRLPTRFIPTVSTTKASESEGPEIYSHFKSEIKSGSTIQEFPGQHQIPEDINTNLFHSPRVARLLGDEFQGCRPTAPHLIPIYNVDSCRTKSATFGVQKNDGVSKPLDSKSRNSNKLESDQKPKPSIITTDSKLSPIKMRESRVPSSRLARFWNYSSLAAGMVGGIISEGIWRADGNRNDGISYVLNSKNINRLVTKLSRMRGAALKFGQLISFQDSNLLPAPVLEVLQKVQDGADYMPAYQRYKVLEDNLNSDWRDLFSSFDEIPLAAASVGQVHRAVLKTNGAQVAVKVQYPGVAKSIDSDLKNLEILLTASRLLPKGLFLDKTISNARTELAWECDYLREAECTRRFQQLLQDDSDVFVVPKVYSEATAKQVLTMEFMNGEAITRIKNLTQEQKDWIGTQILRLCLREIFEFRFMQTDPNWTNFLFNKDSGKLELLDFGASREYDKNFISNYAKLLAAASRSDKESLRKLSIELGYLTGYEPQTMLDAHISSVLTLAEPFSDCSSRWYDFSNQTITDRVREFIPVMMRERLTPPPEETYSLHRKLSGAFLLCARLGSRVPCRKLFEESFKKINHV